MVKITLDGELQRALMIADKIRSEFSDILIIWGANQSQTDDDLTLSDLSMYIAGQMDGWMLQLDNGVITVADIAGYIDATTDEIHTLHVSWKLYNMTQRKNAIRKILIDGAEREAMDKGE